MSDVAEHPAGLATATAAGSDRAPVPQTPKLRSAAFGAACISLQPILLSALMLPATAYVIRGLGPTAYGQWATATALVAATSFLTNLGLRGTFVRAVAREPETASQAFAEQLGIRTVLGVLAAIVALGACALLGYSRTVLLCTTFSVLALVLTTIASTANDLLQALHRLPTIAMVNLVGGALLTAASVIAIYLGAGPVGVAATYLSGPVLSVVMLLLIVQRRHVQVKLHWNTRRSLKRLWEARFFAAQQLVATVSNNAEALIIPRLLGPTAFGFFSAGTLLPTRLTAIPDGIGTAAYPAIAGAHRKAPEATPRIVLRFLLLIAAVCIPAALTAGLLASQIAQLLFPGRGEVCAQVLRITIWLLPLMGLHCVMSYALNAMNKDAVQARASLLGGMAALLTTGVLVWQCGLIGACWSMVLRQAFHVLVLTLLLVRTVRPALWRAVVIEPAHAR